MTPPEYWREAAETAFDEMGLYHVIEAMTVEQRAGLGKSLATSHEHYGMAVYSLPASDRIADIERCYKAKIAKLETDAERYRRTAERTVARVLNQSPDANLSISENGDVIRYGGRIERIA